MGHPETHYAAHDIEARILAALRAAEMDPDEPLSPEDLGALDQFHTGGLDASRELMLRARIAREHRVVDLGAGLGGAARFLASEAGCQVDCVDPSADYCAGAHLLNRLTRLEDRIAVHQASALELPFPDDSFDVAWMQNVGMNIADKPRLYAEIHRVLAPGGRFAFQEMAAGDTPTSYFPLPWASQPADSFLASTDEMRAGLAAAGFELDSFEDVSAVHLERGRRRKTSTPQRLSLSVFVDDLKTKGGNAHRSLAEGQIKLVWGVFRAT
jgi:SAM-dependent methyltransferase